MKTYLYRQGNGNEGNFAQFTLTLSESDNAWAAIRALMANLFIPNTKTRSHVMRAAESDGEEQYGITGIVYEGPKGETDFGAAWLTAELEPIKPDSITGRVPHYETLRDALDVYAYRFYLRLCAKG